MFIAEWLKTEVEAGRTSLEALISAAPFPSAAVRTIAEAGDFEITDGHVRLVEDPEFSWFPSAYEGLEQRGSTWVLRVPVTQELVDGSELTVPRALAALCEVPRMSRVTLDTEKSAQLLHLFNDRAVLGPIDRFLGDEPGGVVEIEFDVDSQSMKVSYA